MKEDLNLFICKCCKKQIMIPNGRWAPSRGADFFSCDWKERDMLRLKLCGECSDSVRDHLKKRMLKQNIKMNENSLEYFSKSGILPLIASEKGIDNEPIENVTICGTLNYGNNRPLPDGVELIYRDKHETEKRALYIIAIGGK